VESFWSRGVDDSLLKSSDHLDDSSSLSSLERSPERARRDVVVTEIKAAQENESEETSQLRIALSVALGEKESQTRELRVQKAKIDILATELEENKKLEASVASLGVEMDALKEAQQSEEKTVLDLRQQAENTTQELDTARNKLQETEKKHAEVEAALQLEVEQLKKGIDAAAASSDSALQKEREAWGREREANGKELTVCREALDKAVTSLEEGKITTEAEAERRTKELETSKQKPASKGLRETQLGCKLAQLAGEAFADKGKQDSSGHIGPWEEDFSWGGGSDASLSPSLPRARTTEKATGEPGGGDFLACVTAAELEESVSRAVRLVREELEGQIQEGNETRDMLQESSDGYRARVIQLEKDLRAAEQAEFDAAELATSTTVPEPIPGEGEERLKAEAEALQRQGEQQERRIGELQGELEAAREEVSKLKEELNEAVTERHSSLEGEAAKREQGAPAVSEDNTVRLEDSEGQLASLEASLEEERAGRVMEQSKMEEREKAIAAAESNHRLSINAIEIELFQAKEALRLLESQTAAQTLELDETRRKLGKTDMETELIILRRTNEELMKRHAMQSPAYVGYPPTAWPGYPQHSPGGYPTSPGMMPPGVQVPATPFAAPNSPGSPMAIWQPQTPPPQLQTPPQPTMGAGSVPSSPLPIASPGKPPQQTEPDSVERDAPQHLTPKEKLKWRKQERQRIEDSKTQKEAAANIAAKHSEAQARETSRARDAKSHVMN